MPSQKSSTSKGTKNTKKNNGKGKKKGGTVPKNDVALTLESNGPLDKNTVNAD